MQNKTFVLPEEVHLLYPVDFYFRLVFHQSVIYKKKNFSTDKKQTVT